MIIFICRYRYDIGTRSLLTYVKFLERKVRLVSYTLAGYLDKIYIYIIHLHKRRVRADKKRQREKQKQYIITNKPYTQINKLITSLIFRFQSDTAIIRVDITRHNRFLHWGQLSSFCILFITLLCVCEYIIFMSTIGLVFPTRNSRTHDSTRLDSTR